LAVAEEKATNDAEVQVARKLIDLAKAEYEESLAINKRSPGTIPETTLRRQRVTWEKAVLDALAAEMTFKIAGLSARRQLPSLRRSTTGWTGGRSRRLSTAWSSSPPPAERMGQAGRAHHAFGPDGPPARRGLCQCRCSRPDQLKNAEVKIVLDLAGTTRKC
jgi:hypothetical protein